MVITQGSERHSREYENGSENKGRKSGSIIKNELELGE